MLVQLGFKAKTAEGPPASVLVELRAATALEEIAVAIRRNKADSARRRSIFTPLLVKALLVLARCEGE